MFTRKQYMDNEVSFETYYGQFVTPYILDLVKSKLTEEKIKESKDEHFNDFTLSIFDYLGTFIPNSVLLDLGKANGTGGYSKSDLVCLIKTACKQIRGW